MIRELGRGLQLVRNMGLRYVGFRVGYELQRRSGLLSRRFPIQPAHETYFTLEAWKKQPVNFFFNSREDISMPRKPSAELAKTVDKIKQGIFTFFSGPEYDIGTHYDWITNPDSGYRYNGDQHWTTIEDYSKEAGDIKFVWEKSRFSYLYDIIRHDYHFNTDHAEWVFSEMLSWIEHNEVNCGPNYKCSQEISLRILNWTFALHYYKNSSFLTQEIFDKIQYAIYWQLEHVYQNINFSRIAVRNNHAITETLMLYLGGLLYPLYHSAAIWKEKGKRWFEKEVAYQIYEDGTFLQFSMNYHRVVVQLLTWAIRLAEINNECFPELLIRRAVESLKFLRVCMNDKDGWLPNYGANDGALFFKLNDCHYRDYRPQLEALSYVLKSDDEIDGDFEDKYWYGYTSEALNRLLKIEGQKLFSFREGGYYISREPNSLTFIRCGNHKDRPSQADNLHLDVWHNGANVLLDSGTYKYNVNKGILKYFMGTASHNTVMLGDHDQMEKGEHFIWYNWTQCENVSFFEVEDGWVFEGTVKAFTYIGRGIRHKRIVKKEWKREKWIVEDLIVNKPAEQRMNQLWHILPGAKLIFVARDKGNKTIIPQLANGWVSSLYGSKETTETVIFSTQCNYIMTEIVL